MLVARLENDWDQEIVPSEVLTCTKVVITEKQMNFTGDVVLAESTDEICNDHLVTEMDGMRKPLEV